MLAVGLVAVASWLSARPGGRVSAIALAATGVAAAYMDVIAVTTIYDWVSTPVALAIAAVIGGGGLTLARRWDSEHLGLLVLVPLIILAPVVTDGITLLLVGFMLALSAAALPVQLGKDWIWMHAARTAAGTFPLLVALAASAFDSGDDLWLAAACGIAAALAIVGALILLPRTRNQVAMALLTAAGVLPVLCVSLAVDRVIAALMAAALAAALLAIVCLGDRLPNVGGVVSQIWSALSAVSALIAVTVAFDGEVAGPVLLAMAVVVAVAGRRDDIARWAAFGFAIVGGGLYVSYASPSALVGATVMATPDAVSTLVSSVLLVACAVAITWSWVSRGELDNDTARTLWAGSAAVIVYAITTFTVTAGVLIGGEGRGFFAGHMAATICWIAMAAGLFVYAARRSREERSLPIAGGLALVAAAMAKLFLFDLSERWTASSASWCSSWSAWCYWAWVPAMPVCWRNRTRRCEGSHGLIWTRSSFGGVETSMATATRRTEAEVQAFQGSPELSADLQRVLVDLIELHLQGKQAHWNVVGTNFRDLHLQLDEVVDFAREASDTIAERMRALDAVPDGRSDTVAASTTLPQFPAYEHSTTEVVDLITARVYAAVDTMRAVHDAVDAEDPSTADILHQLIDGLEKLAWLIKSENRKV